MKVSLWDKFKMDENRDNYRTVYRGNDFTMCCTVAGQECADKFGHGGTMHANKDGMEMAIEQWGKVVLYVGPARNLNDGKGNYIGLVWKN